MAYRNILLLLGALLLGFGLGWWLGSRKEPIEVVREEVRYVEGPRTTIYIERPTPYKVSPLPRLVFLHDTVCVYNEVHVTTPADTASIVADYLKRREYALDFSSDTTGIFKVDAIVEANRLASASATIQPIQREVHTTTREVRAFRPYIGGDVALGAKVGVSLEVGALLKDHHLPRVGYQRLGKDNYLTIGYGYTF